MKYYRVQTGFGADDFVSVDETELEMCIRAQITGKVAITKAGTITGTIIQKITPDWQRVLGYNRDYKMQGEDYDELPRRTQDEYREAFAEATENVQLRLSPPTGSKLLTDESEK